MEIKTKFAIGDEVWTIRKCKAVNFKIETLMYNGECVYYGTSTFELTHETQCFATKEELIKQLTDD